MIFTLDDKAWKEDELIEKMKDDSFYFGYMGQNSLSSSSIKTLAKDPNKYLASIGGESQHNPAFDFGSLFHWYVLEPHVYKEQVFVDAAKRAGKEWKEALSDNNRVFLKKDKDKVEEIAEIFLSCSKVDHILKHSTPEVPMVGTINGHCFRAKADILGDGYIADLKTCQNIKWFKSDAWKFGYAAQVYIYTELFGIDYSNWVFIAVDKSTGDFGFYTVSEQFYLSGKQIVEDGIANYELIKNGQTHFEPFYTEGVL